MPYSFFTQDQRTISLSLIFSIFLFPFSLFSPEVEASGISQFSDTLSDSDLSVVSNHTISYTSTNAVAAGDTIEIILDPDTDAFALGTLAFADISFSGATLVSGCGGGGDEVTVATSTAPDDIITFTVCAGDTVSAGAKTITLGGNKITNPATPGSYAVQVDGTQADSGETRVVVLDDITLSAEVLTSFTFSISGVASGLSINGEGTVTSTTTTATSMPFGLLEPGTPKVAAQTLSVTTNAPNGFAVTVRQNQNLTSSTGADIDVFEDGLGTFTPITWDTPSAVSGSENTYGHFGVTSEDNDLNGDEFGTALYAGNFATTSRTVFSHTSIADGVTAHIGQTRVGFKIEISSLQEAGSDYSNTLTYVATPTF